MQLDTRKACFAACLGHEVLATELLHNYPEAVLFDNFDECGRTFFYECAYGSLPRVMQAAMNKLEDSQFKEAREAYQKKHGVDVPQKFSKREQGGWTPLLNAAFRSDKKTLDLLLNFFKKKLGEEGRTPKEIESIIAKEVNKGTAYNQTPLYWAMWHKANGDFVRTLLEEGADPVFTGPDVQNPLGSWDSLFLFLKLKFLDNTTPYPLEYSPLHLAARLDRSEILKQFCESKKNKGSMINLDTPSHTFKRTPLHEACQEGNEESVRILCEHGANPLIETPQGRNALQFIKSKPHPSKPNVRSYGKFFNELIKQYPSQEFLLKNVEEEEKRTFLLYDRR